MTYTLDRIDTLTVMDYILSLTHIPELKSRISSKLFFTDRLRSAYGYYLAKKMISKELNCNVDDLVISTNPFGKPFIINCPWYFNIAHSGIYLVCAIDSHEIGVDIEEIKPFSPSELDYFCSEAEITYIQGSQDIAERERRFCDVWTFKEAFYKLKGGRADFYPALSMPDFSKSIIRKYVGNYVMTICSHNNVAG